MRDIWGNVDEYFISSLHQQDRVLEHVLQANHEAGLPAIDVSPTQGKFLYLLAKLKGAKRILEIGTLGGYSSIWMGRALPEDGKLVTLEYSQKHAEVARGNIKKAGLETKIEIMVGPALESLPMLKDKGYSSFDFIFIDADKSNNPHYLKWALAYSEPGTVIIGDNVVRNGRVADQKSEDVSVQGSRALIDLLAKENRMEATALQTVGSKGYDGFVMGIVK
ncbi:Predicted O-methyltransferase YrrM [Fictibacillus solisalsi]|uniref:Predicted O-methyltransferase YrrM n=1 Tax=Fictibacillus solisalsi TaxID=459525 RepID=A0A1G9TSR0_9BACL|nr:O-methyltransferase [Fictibacillus solisalsi]SDM50265.1 Predicted O-methyltransferase YrrM [Fictibacillus solisalsi]